MSNEQEQQTIDVTTLRAGDEVLIRTTFVRLGASGAPIVKVAGADNSLSQGAVAAECIASVSTRRARAGDRVKTSPNGGTVWTVAHTHDRWAWLVCADGDCGIVRPLSMLEIV